MTEYEGLLSDFVLEGTERLNRVEELLLGLPNVDAASASEALVDAKRELHTLKGNAGMMGLTDLQALAHQMEDAVDRIDCGSPQVQTTLEEIDQFRAILNFLMDQHRPAASHEQQRAGASQSADPVSGSVRVPFAALDSLMDLLAEMVIFRNRLSESIRTVSRIQSGQSWDEVVSAEESLGKTLSQIQDQVMRLRMVPLRMLFGHLQRIVHDEAAREGKQARFEGLGGETPMDKALLEVANEMLGHLVRNAVIHGLEISEVRKRAGKPAEGLVRISAITQSEEVQIDVVDDGAGIDREGLAQAAARQGLEIPADEELYRLLFMPGVSTRQKSDVSAGRGIGLSVALRSVQRAGGRFEVQSEKGRGTCLRVHLPLSVSITRALLVRADGENYALPLTAVIESLRFQRGDGHQINHAGVFRWRENIVPLVDIGYVFGTAGAPRESGYVVVMQAEGKLRGLIVNDVTGIREIVVKQLDPVVGSPGGIAGSTILGDGRVVLILDPAGMALLQPFVAERPARPAL